MKTTTFTLLLLLSCCQWLAAQCPTGDITFSTQGQIDSFQINYPGCTEIEGVVIISGNDITHLDSLYAIQKIYSLNIKDNPSLYSLTGLENLIQAGNSCYIGLSIENNDALNSLEGLNNLTTIRCGVAIKDNDGLVNLLGLESLDTIQGCGCGIDSYVGGSLHLESNDNLVSLHGLEQLKSVDGMSIVDNDLLGGFEALQSLEYVYSIFLSSCDLIDGLEELTNIDTMGYLTIDNQVLFTSLEGLPYLDSLSQLTIENNSFLKSLDGIEKIESLFELSIINNDSLTSLGGNYVIPIDSSAGRIVVRDNELLASIEGLNILEAVGKLEISDNPSLTSLHGLESLEMARLSGCCHRGCSHNPVPCYGAGDIQILNNDSLTDLSGLENLKFINRWLDIIGNGNLVTLAGLNSLDSIGPFPFLSAGIWLEDNSLLSDCATQVICSLFPSIVSVENNSFGCNSIVEIESLCANLPPAVPLLISPMNAAVEVNNPVELDWAITAFASSYSLQLSTDAGFTALVVDSVIFALDSFVTSPLNANTDYYWRVKAMNPVGESAWSEVWSFSILEPPVAPVLVAPAIGSIGIPLATSISWLPVEYADRYSIQVALGSGFANLIVWDTDVTDTFYQVANLDYQTIYYWRVKAINMAGGSDWSEAWYFTTEMMTDAKESASPISVRLFPNPATDQVHVLMSNNAVLESIEFLNSVGQAVKQINYPGTTINVSEMPAGFYAVKLKMAGRLLWLKLIIE